MLITTFMFAVEYFRILHIPILYSLLRNAQAHKHTIILNINIPNNWSHHIMKNLLARHRYGATILYFRPTDATAYSVLMICLIVRCMERTIRNPALIQHFWSHEILTGFLSLIQSITILYDIMTRCWGYAATVPTMHSYT